MGGAREQDVHDAAALAGWIAMTRSAVDDLTFTVEVPPVFDGERFALRGQASGHDSGGFPGATAAPGPPIAFTGIDLLRINDGRLAEHRTNSAVHVLMTCTS